MLPAPGLPGNEASEVNLAAAVTAQLHLPLLREKALTAAVLRLDLIHPVVSGNKWFKLRYHFQSARQQGCSTIITFGGAYSNHLVATAFAAREHGFKSAGLVRGERASTLSHTLQASEKYGMTLHFMDRHAYAEKAESPSIQHILKQYPATYLVPEGGAGDAGILGCRAILPLAERPASFTHLLCCIGTGTMFSGLADSMLPHQELIGIPVLKLAPDAPLLQHLVDYVASKQKKCRVITGYDFGGYARKTGELLRFMNGFYEQTGIPTDFVYTAKLMYAFTDLAGKNFFPPGSRILLVHSGGLQGNGSLPPGAIRY